MSVREVEQIDDQGMAAWDAHNTDGFANLFADSFEWRDPTIPEPIHNIDGVRQYMQSWFTAFPDMHVRTINRVVSDDAIGAEVEITGTNNGPLTLGGQEIPATGKSVVAHGTYFAKVRDGKLVEFSTHPDVAEMMAQLGLMPQS